MADLIFHDVEFDRDEEPGWVIARCDCGWDSPPCPSEDEAAGFWGDHREEVGSDGR